MTIRFDHAVVIVEDLNGAADDYRSLGFNVVPGGTHAGGWTRNALIPFLDGTYLELLTFTQSNIFPDLRSMLDAGSLAAELEGRSALDRRFLPLVARGEGLADSALSVPDVTAIVNAARQRGFAIDGPLPGSRVRPDGIQIEWELAMPETSEIPFLIADVTDRALRVPGPEHAQHTNGVIGVASVTYRTGEDVEYGGMLRSLIDVAPSQHPGGESAERFDLGATALIVTSDEPHQVTTGMNTGVVSLALRAESLEPTGGPTPLDQRYSHGALINLVPA